MNAGHKSIGHRQRNSLRAACACLLGNRRSGAPFSRVAVFLALLAGVAFMPATAQAGFGIKPESLRFSAEDREGNLLTQAGAHPYVFNLSFELNMDEATGKTEGGELRNTITKLPPGLIGNPVAVPACPRQSFEGPLPNCPPSTQVGMLRVILPAAHSEAFGPIYNLVPPPGDAAQLGFSAAEFTALLSASVSGEEGYGIRILAPNAPLEVSSVAATIWGTPADPSHDAQRGSYGGEHTDAPPLPFLTMPTSCLAPLQLGVAVDSKPAPGNYAEEIAFFLDKGGNPLALSGCEAVPFSPAVVSAPTSTTAESASGLGLGLELPDQGLTNAKEGTVAETEPEAMEVELPAGITTNPAAANGLAACTEAQIGFKEMRGPVAVFDEAQPSCPDASKLGTLTARTPLLEEAIEGSVYLATPRQNPFGSLLGLYFVARAPQRGVLIKLAGQGYVDPTTGQLRTTIEGMPPVPYSAVELHLREGPQAPLITPQACGRYRTVARLRPFSDPAASFVREAPFTISSGAHGGACASSEADLPNVPALLAGSTATNAGGYSPFVFRLSREDGTQRFGSLTAEPPAGLVAKLAGIPYCPEAGIAQAVSRSAEGDGAKELASPSCPAASQVGTVIAGAGAGPTPYYVQGKAYLAGPYKGAPLSLEIITPAIAGPFDLGAVAVRSGIYVNEETAKITVKSDPLPSILHGFPLDVRSVSVLMDRNQFTRNPTNCEPTSVNGSLTSLAGAIAPLSERFRVGGCRGLEFKPKLKISLKGQTKRSGHPALKAVVTFPKEGESANIASAQVGLPHSEFLDQANLDKVCTQAQLHSHSCPPRSIYGHAKAWSPLLEKPLEGPVYLGVGYGHLLPDVVADLNGQIRILLHGKVDTTKQHGIRNTFEVVPDAPVSRFVLELKGGKRYGLLVNSENVCGKTQRASAKFTGQNGKVAQLHPKIDNGCGKKKAKR